jgi:hypothetical protein
MLRSCIICSAGESPDFQLVYCAACQSAMYCSRACQREDWKKQHKKICNFLNVGHGYMQVWDEDHTNRSNYMQRLFEESERSFDEDDKRFFKLFQESTFQGSRAAARKMKKIAKRQTKTGRKFLVFHSLRLLARSPSEMLLWPNSPLLVMLQFVDPNMLSGDEHDALEKDESRETLLHHLSDLAAASDYSTHENQLILAKQLIEHGANVNAVSTPQRKTPLHNACYSDNVTNLDFVELLMEGGADPNAQDHLGVTPLMYTTPAAPGAAKFLLNWPTTDANITTRSGASFLAMVREAVKYYSERVAFPDNPDKVQHQFLLQQWRGIGEMLMERGALDTSIAAHL